MPSDAFGDVYLEFEPDPVGFGDVEEFDEFAPDAVDLLDVFLRACPHLDAVNLGAQTDDRAADLVALVEFLANEGHAKPLPALVEQRRVVFHREHPLPTVRIRLVLPHRLDPRLEQVVVRVALQLGRRLEPVEVPAIRFDRIELADGRQACFIGTGVGRCGVRGSIRGGLWRERYLGLCVVVYSPKLYKGEKSISCREQIGR